ncbi:MAG: oxygen-independent coproporphyrinogen III oxidase [Lutibacter sp.]|uniref:oxygen-independent coproporphyrinogen III oxidase n=1 Tax=Lutibacter sp. TaxID=1925666 RepID=UPI0018136C85|nr:oxygen-independent coproporphyrinogen III oxidase [Lutibacter sp.]MBT8317446.1 oxygen-independent coproporphyrinogen III oxidase [Lutibacter sp.]NNJ58305.1 oxygen-independent coproporphyrinogen III oxidase [Lutibacter sp.]
MSKLIQKYNIPGPRYTSYPTVPFWDKEGITLQDWKNTVKKSFDESNDHEGISLYIHLPFCESLCTFCACHKKITKRHEVEQPYMDTVLKEWDLYCDLLVERPKIREIHLGGGTPTFFSSANLKKLINGIFKRADKFETFDFSYEGHPNHTSEDQLQTLYDLGSRRNSFGIQDYDPIVQKAIHRVQSFEQVKRVNDLSRKIGYESISHDLIFGLPFQTEESIRNTIKNTIALKPDRIAYYSYAHVPWIKGVGQRGFDENDLPKDSEKRHLYELGKQLFFDNGYVEIGMDHFALPTDSLHKAMEAKKLHRNFMGYTAGKTELMIGLGMSSISDSWYAFAQNEKTIEAYTEKVNKGIIPIFRGHLLTETDLIIRKHILNLMCNLETEWKIGLDTKVKNEIVDRLSEIVDDGLIDITDNRIKVKEEGRMFVRNICMAFDLRLIENKPETRVFSMTI